MADSPGEFSDLFMKKVQELLPDTLGQIEEIWENIGFPHEERARRTEIYFQAARTMMMKAARAQDDEYNDLVAKIEITGNQVLSLAGELNVKSTEPDEHLSVLQLAEFLDSYLKELQQEKESRLNSFESLTTEAKELETILGSPPVSYSPDSVPTAKQLEELRTRIAEFRKEKDRRYCLFSSLRATIMRLWNSLECNPETSFERRVADADDNFPLTTQSLDAMDALKDKLESESEVKAVEAEELRDRILMLWNLLHMPIQELFLANNMGFSRSMIKALKEELHNLEIQKAENIQTLIARLREEILMYWDKCLYSQDQKEAFLPYYSDDCTEEVLGQHEKYFKKLKDLHQECHVLFEKVIRLKDLFEKLVTFVTKKDFNGDRFNNRGGALLKEEKERKKVQTLIPKLETEIKTAVRLWESKHDSRFTVYGKSFVDYVTGLWEAYDREKENERLERQMKKTRDMEGAGCSTSMGGKRLYSQLGTPLSARANKISRIITPMSSTSRMTPMSRVCTRSILRSQNTCSTPLGKPPLSSSKIISSQHKQKVHPRRLHQKATPFAKKSLTKKSSFQPNFNPFVTRDLETTALLPTSNASTYSEFQCKLDLCSTLVHDPISGPPSARRQDAS